MLNPVQIEQAYREIAEHLADQAHDGIVQVDLQFLHDNGLLQALQEERSDAEDVTQYFHVTESVDKVTLFNEQFIVWIIPKMDGDQSITYVMIALNYPDKVHLEIVFTTRGVYNTPRHVLTVLQHFLIDMLETEATITSIEKSQ
jgi:hypothetical protein